MILIVGGLGQGKLAYVLEQTGAGAAQVARDAQSARTARIFDGCTQWVRRRLAEGGDPDGEMDALLRENPDIVLIFDEVGCGVVPMEAEQRLWRERTGRLTCALAKRARRVERILCGLPMVLKEDGAWN